MIIIIQYEIYIQINYENGISGISPVVAQPEYDCYCFYYDDDNLMEEEEKHSCISNRRCAKFMVYHIFSVLPEQIVFLLFASFMSNKLHIH